MEAARWALFRNGSRLQFLCSRGSVTAEFAAQPAQVNVNLRRAIGVNRSGSDWHFGGSVDRRYLFRR
jgi:hypothetical protein